MSILYRIFLKNRTQLSDIEGKIQANEELSKMLSNYIKMIKENKEIDELNRTENIIQREYDSYMKIHKFGTVYY